MYDSESLKHNRYTRATIEIDSLKPLEKSKAANLTLKRLSTKYQKKFHGALILVQVLVRVNMVTLFQYYAITVN